MMILVWFSYGTEQKWIIMSRISSVLAPQPHTTIANSLWPLHRKMNAKQDHVLQQKSDIADSFAKISLLKGDVDYHLVCASMIIIYFFFG
jgi:hypothetical protein